jgi:hypothetical protein
MLAHLIGYQDSLYVLPLFFTIFDLGYNVKGTN